MTSSISPIPVSPLVHSLVIREGDFSKWLEAAKPGDRLEYHLGHLGVDRARGFSHLHEKSRRELCVVADRVASLADEGRLVLVQWRVGDGLFSYVAIVAKNPTGQRSQARSFA